MKKLKIKTYGLTDIGRQRSSNQDFQGNLTLSKKSPLPGITVIAVADGMGGHAGGEVASKLAIETFLEEIQKSFEEHHSQGIKYDQLTLDIKNQVKDILKDAVKKSNDVVYRKSCENPRLNGMGTTLTVAVILNGVAIFANVGDSRGYLISNGKIHQVTNDHSWGAEQVLAGLISEEQARNHPRRNIITRSIGTLPSVEIDLEEKNIQKGDIVFLCSDGLYPVLSDSQIINEFNLNKTNLICKSLVDKANDKGGPDNIAVAFARLESNVQIDKKIKNANVSTEKMNQETLGDGKINSWFMKFWQLLQRLF